MGPLEQGKQAKIFFEKATYWAQNRATKTRYEGFFNVEENFLQPRTKDDLATIPFHKKPVPCMRFV